MAIIPSDEQAQMRVPNGGEDAERPDDTDGGWDVAGSTLKRSLTVSMKTEHAIVTCSLGHQCRALDWRPSSHRPVCEHRQQIHSRCLRAGEHMRQSDHGLLCSCRGLLGQEGGQWTSRPAGVSGALWSDKKASLKKIQTQCNSQNGAQHVIILK